MEMFINKMYTVVNVAEGNGIVEKRPTMYE